MRLVRELEKLRFHTILMSRMQSFGPEGGIRSVSSSAMVRLFGLHRITPYKKGRVSEKRLAWQLCDGIC